MFHKIEPASFRQNAACENKRIFRIVPADVEPLLVVPTFAVDAAPGTGKQEVALAVFPGDLKLLVFRELFADFSEAIF